MNKVIIDTTEFISIDNTYLNMVKEAELALSMLELQILNEAYLTEDGQGVKMNQNNTTSANADKINATLAAKGKELDKKIFHNVKQIFHKIFDAFVNKVRNLTTNNREWLSNDAKHIKNITGDFWEDCTITINPYITGNRNLHAFEADITASPIKFAAISSNADKITSDDKLDNKKDLLEFCSSYLASFNANSAGNAAKMHYRGFNNGANQDLHEVTGDVAAKLCNDLVAYANNYPNLVNTLKADLAGLEAGVRNAAKKYEIPISLEGFYPLYEAEENNDLKRNTSSEKDATGQTSTSNPVKNQEKIARRLVAYWKLAFEVQAARMTIAEECYNTSMKTLRTILNNATKRDQVKGLENGKKSEG